MSEVTGANASPSEPIFQGEERHSWLIRRGRELARAGWSVSAVEDILLVENSWSCLPPLEPTDVQQVATRAVDAEQFPFSGRSETFAKFAALRPLAGAWDDEVESLSPPEWLIEDVIPMGALAVDYGAPESGKTFVAIDMAFCLGTNSLWHGRAVKHGVVIFVAGEGVGGLPRRIRAWKKFHSWEGRANVRFVTVAVNLLDPDQVFAFIEEHRTEKPVAVVFDTLARCMPGGDDERTKDVGLIIEQADRIRAALRTTVLLLHHPTKTKADIERGSGALRAAVDTMVKQKRKKGDDAITFSCEKQKDADAFAPIQLRLRTVLLEDGQTSCVVVSDDEDTDHVEPGELTAKQRQALEALAATPELGETPTTWRKKSDISERSIYRHVEHFLKVGYVKKSNSGAKYWITAAGIAAVSEPATAK